MPVQLDRKSNRALQAKIALRSKIDVSLESLRAAPEALDAAPLDAAPLAAVQAAALPAGQFVGLESIRLRWVRPDRFEFIPKSRNPFGFRRANGELVQPRRMFTDGGSIPRIFRWSSDLDPWGFGPAYLVHDWEFDLHHCGRSAKSFEDVRDTMMEAVRTLMDSGVSPSSPFVFQMIYLGIDSFVARQLWNTPSRSCPLPPDQSE